MTDDVLDMQQAFSENWQEVTGSLLPKDAFPPQPQAGPSRAVFVKSRENSIATENDKLLQLMIASARKRIWIANAYFVPGRKMRHALVTAARRGVKVALLLQGRYESFMQFYAARSVYGTLLQT